MIPRIGVEEYKYGKSSETSALKTQMPGDYPKDTKWHSTHGKSLKSRQTTLSDVACIPITEPVCQLTNMLDFTSQTFVQFIWARGQGQTKGKFCILNTHGAAMQKGGRLQNP